MFWILDTISAITITMFVQQKRKKGNTERKLLHKALERNALTNNNKSHNAKRINEFIVRWKINHCVKQIVANFLFLFFGFCLKLTKYSHCCAHWRKHKDQWPSNIAQQPHYSKRNRFIVKHVKRIIIIDEWKSKRRIMVSYLQSFMLTRVQFNVQLKRGGRRVFSYGLHFFWNSHFLRIRRDIKHAWNEWRTNKTKKRSTEMCAGKVWQREIAKVISISDVVKSISGPLF